MTKFEVTENHLKLLRRSYVSWESCEFGAPSIDCKRPYGNSNVYTDIAKIIGIELKGNDWTDEQINIMNKIHKETETVLQIILVTGLMKPGVYQSEPYKNKWKLID